MSGLLNIYRTIRAWIFVSLLIGSILSASAEAKNDTLYEIDEELIRVSIASFKKQLNLSLLDGFELDYCVLDRSMQLRALEVDRVATFDVGSTGIRVAVADICKKTGTVSVLSYFKYPMEFGVNMLNAKDRIAAVGGIKQVIEHLFGRGIRYEAVATAGFRAAGEYGYELAQIIEEVTQVSFTVIDQKTEGLLAFKAAQLAAQSSTAENIVVWDIGGGSMQFAAKEKESGLVMAGCKVAARTFLEEAMRFIKNDISLETPNPMSKKEVSSALVLAGHLMAKTEKDKRFGGSGFDGQVLGVIKEKISQGSRVLGVGGVHSYQVLPFVCAVLGEKRDYYTADELFDTIDSLTGYTDEQIQFIADGFDYKLQSPSFILTSLVLVYAAMALMDIQSVKVISVDNTDGLLAMFVEDVKEESLKE